MRRALVPKRDWVTGKFRENSFLSSSPPSLHTVSSHPAKERSVECRSVCGAVRATNVREASMPRGTGTSYPCSGVTKSTQESVLSTQPGLRLPSHAVPRTWTCASSRVHQVCQVMMFTGAHSLACRSTGKFAKLEAGPPSRSQVGPLVEVCLVKNWGCTHITELLSARLWLRG